jgi:hypothetical protein
LVYLYTYKNRKKCEEIKESQLIKFKAMCTFKNAWHLNIAFLEATHLDTVVEKMSTE